MSDSRGREAIPTAWSLQMRRPERIQHFMTSSPFLSPQKETWVWHAVMKPTSIFRDAFLIWELNWKQFRTWTMNSACSLLRRVEWRLPCKPASGEGGKRKHIERFWYKHHERQLIIKSISKRLWKWGNIYQKDVFSQRINIPTAITPLKFNSIHSALSTLSQADGCSPNPKLHRHKGTGIKHSIWST